MIVELELAVIIGLQAVPLFHKRSAVKTPALPEQDAIKLLDEAAHTPAPDELQAADPAIVELLVEVNGTWIHHSWRPYGHPDIAVALNDPKMAVAYHHRIVDEGIR